MAKEAEAVVSSQAPALTQLEDAPADQSSNLPLSPDVKYCTVCTSLGNCALMNSLHLQTGMKILRKKKEKMRIKKKITSLSVQTGMHISNNMIGKIRKLKIKNTMKERHPENSTTFLSATTFTQHPPESLHQTVY